MATGKTADHRRQPALQCAVHRHVGFSHGAADVPGRSGVLRVSANFLTAFRMFRFKSVIDDGYSRRTSYNPSIDTSAAGAGDLETEGFWGTGGGKTWALKPVSVDAQAWYFKYMDYADMTYLQGRAIRA